jgi:hypothetical protein
VSHAKKSGKPNMKIKDCCSYTNSELLFVVGEEKALSERPISHSAVIKWLLRLGFKICSHKKGMIKDCHDDMEVIHYRQKVYLPQMKN